MKYKIGDKVRIKSLDWYNRNKDKNGYVDVGVLFDEEMSRWCGKTMTIIKVNQLYYTMEEDDISHFFWTDEMFEGLVEDESANYSKVIDNDVSNPIIAKTSSATIDTDKGFYSYSSDGNLEMEWNLPQGYQFVDENGNIINATKIVLEKKKKEYPKTYEECCKILGDVTAACWSGYKCGVLGALNKLLICRDAYWKLYGEEMGLGKPWKPDWTNQKLAKYCIAGVEGQVKTAERYIVNTILAFPTAEMRDAFYENFKEEIENCKELL